MFVLTVCRVSHWIWLCVVIHAVYKLRANRCTVTFNCFNLWRTRRGVCPKNCLAIFPAVCVVTCVAATDWPHWESKQTNNRKPMGSYAEKWRDEHVCITHKDAQGNKTKQKGRNSMLYWNISVYRMTGNICN